MNPSADYAVFSLEEIRSTLNAPAERRRRKY
jgi:hypothetical protein